MPSQKLRRLDEIRQYVAVRGLDGIGEAEFSGLRTLLAPISDRALRSLLRESELPLSPSVEGVRQEDFDHLERTLAGLEVEYTAAVESGDATRARGLRELVITAKDHARLAGRSARDEQKRADKEEMVEWMLVWLENPSIFQQWVRLRRRAGPIEFRSTPPG